MFRRSTPVSQRRCRIETILFLHCIFVGYVSGMVLFIISQQKYAPECHMSYLALETIVSIRRNFRSVFAYNHTESGLITSVLGQIIRDKCVVLAGVRHPQRVNDPHVQLSNQTGVS